MAVKHLRIREHSGWTKKKKSLVKKAHFGFSSSTPSGIPLVNLLQLVCCKTVQRWTASDCSGGSPPHLTLKWLRWESGTKAEKLVFNHTLGALSSLTAFGNLYVSFHCLLTISPLFKEKRKSIIYLLLSSHGKGYKNINNQKAFISLDYLRIT